MSADDFERTLRDRMKVRAAELDRTFGEPRPLRTLLAGRATARRPRIFTRFRVAFAVATVAAATAAVLALALISGSPSATRLPSISPVSSVTPTPLPPLPPLPPLLTIAPSPSTSGPRL